MRRSIVLLGLLSVAFTTLANYRFVSVGLGMDNVQGLSGSSVATGHDQHTGKAYPPYVFKPKSSLSQNVFSIDFGGYHSLNSSYLRGVSVAIEYQQGMAAKVKGSYLQSNRSYWSNSGTYQYKIKRQTFFIDSKAYWFQVNQLAFFTDVALGISSNRAEAFRAFETEGTEPYIYTSKTNYDLAYRYGVGMRWQAQRHVQFAVQISQQSNGKFILGDTHAAEKLRGTNGASENLSALGFGISAAYTF